MSPVLISMEEEISEAFYELNKDKSRSKSDWLHLILTESYPNLEKYWRIACKRVHLRVKEIEKVDPNQHIFVNLHAAYYHYKTQEYFSLIFINQLKGLKPSLIITCIDDIYEIHKRLTNRGGIYHDEVNPSFNDIIGRYHCLLNWRSKEIMMSRFLANQLKCKNYVFAVKHPYRTLFNLVKGKSLRVYLSHPISEVRRLERNNKLSEARKIEKEISEISDLLTEKSTVFLPTTIDEYRIHNEKIKVRQGKEYTEKIKYLPILTKRWDSEKYINPSDKLYINSEFNDLNSLWLKKDSRKRIKASSDVLEGLSDLISDQVTTRDYTLVEQSEAIIIYRPIFNGNASGGVQEEYNYFTKLKEELNTGSTCYIFCPQVDIDKYTIKEFEARLNHDFILTKNLKPCPIKGFDGLSKKETKNLINAKVDKYLIMDVLDEVIDNHSIIINIKNSKRPLGINKINKFKNEFVEEFIKSLSVVSDYESGSTYFEKEQISVSKFIDNIFKIHNK